MFSGVYKGRRVLVTGHTGFKGSWLTTWLLELGAEVGGFSIGIPTNPSNFEVLGLEGRVRHFLGDVRNLEEVRRAFDEFRPEIVIHLAAQALVRKSYEDPVGTFSTNTLGTVHVLEAIRSTPGVQAAVIITSDKCYRNVEWPWGYRETDTLGGEDPYSGSKGAAELVFHSYLHSFFSGPDQLPRVASARAGNVIGGGDWAEDRILPDCVRAWSRSETVFLRAPNATRPWQHVLEPLSGYLCLGAELFNSGLNAGAMSFNFGPQANVDEPVIQLVQAMKEQWPAASWEVDPQAVGSKKEATLLKLACDKALHELGWRAVLSFKETVAFTSAWYGRYYGVDGADMWSFTLGQIREYARDAGERGLRWASGA